MVDFDEVFTLMKSPVSSENDRNIRQHHIPRPEPSQYYHLKQQKFAVEFSAICAHMIKCERYGPDVLTDLRVGLYDTAEGCLIISNHCGY